ncbi:MAG: hypothetical protein WAW17_09280 [Rhodococcus sp. (in: high G+C Gram-positive bacteria)]|uniref:Rv0361 family membrane protein n=1 Tax=Rhodococcus sp. TaxID=1831 RepID=UPI003BAE3897
MSDPSDSYPDRVGGAPEPEDPRRTTATPFLIALTIIVVLLIGIVVAGMISPAEENVTEADRIERTVADFIEAHNRDDADLQASLVCPSYSEERSVLAGREGEITLQKVESSEVNGDRARAEVRIGADDPEGETTGTWQLTRDGDRWVVCN